MWQPQMEPLFDIHVIDTDALSYRQLSHISVPDSKAVEKKRVFTVQLWRTGEETLHHLFYHLMGYCSVKRCTLLLSASLASKWEKPFSDVLTFVHSRLLFASVCSASMCLRGSRVKCRSGLGFDNGAPLQFVMQ